jgi:hypothetical protein
MPPGVPRPASRPLAMKSPGEAPLRVLAQLGDRRRVPNASALVNRPDELDHVFGALEMQCPGCGNPVARARSTSLNA